MRIDRTGVRGAAALGLGLLLSGCAQIGAQTGGEAEVAMAADPCGAAALQELVGTSVGALDAAALPDDRRVNFPGMGGTQEFQADRLSIDVGSDDRIARVYCG